MVKRKEPIKSIKELEEEMDSCQNCLYWRHPKHEPFGHCHRHAPKAPHPPMALGTAWPVTQSYDWCGEFLRREENNESARQMGFRPVDATEKA